LQAPSDTHNSGLGSTENKFIWLLSCEGKEIISLKSKLLIDYLKKENRE
jgi:hypothetical protein